MSHNSSTTSPNGVVLKFLLHRGLPQLLDHVFQKVYNERPRDPLEVLNSFQQNLEESRAWYYNQVMEQFDIAVRRIESDGFTGGATYGGNSPILLNFCIPLPNGNVFEMFPYGEEVEVTPTNYDAFSAILYKYRTTSPSDHNTSAYIGEVIPMLPISARAHLLGENYGTLLRFMEEHLLNPSSAWALPSPDLWDAFQVTFAVPYHSRLFPVCDERSPYDYVPWEEAEQYVKMAMQQLQRLQEISHSHESLNVVFTETDGDPALGGEDHVAEGGHGRHPSRLRIALESCKKTAAQLAGAADRGLPRTTSSLADDAVGIISRTKDMSSEEKQFWEQLMHFLEHKDEIPKDAMSFALRLPRKDVDLRRNGGSIPVSALNYDEFFSFVVARADEVHRGFNGENNAEDDNDVHASHGESTGAASALVKRGGGEGEKHNKIDTSPKMSETWNTSTLTVADVNSPYFHSLFRLLDRFQEGGLTEQNFADLEMYFYLPGVNGAYDLIPNGRHIVVTTENAQEYFDRFRKEVEKVESKEAKGTTARPSSSVAAESPSSAIPAEQVKGSCTTSATPNERMMPKPPASMVRPSSAPSAGNSLNGPVPLATVTVPVSGTAAVLPSTPPPQQQRDDTAMYVNTPASMVRAHCPSKGPGDDSLYLDESDLPFLQQFESHLHAMMGDSPNDPKQNDEVARKALENIKWEVFVPAKHYSIPLRPDGNQLLVAPTEYNEYLSAALKKLREVRRVILEKQRYPAADGSNEFINQSDEGGATTSGLRTFLPAQVAQPASFEGGRVPAKVIQEMEQRRKSAVPVEATEVELSLFSPMHNEGGLFAPPQHLTT